MASMKKSAQERLKELAAGAPVASANVRALARYASSHQCPTASLGFAARVDIDKLLVGTRYEVPFGQSPFAIQRGTRFEESLRENGHRPLLDLLQEHLHYDTTKAIVANLRDGKPPSQGRADKTRERVTAIVAGKKGAPNLIDGAVLSRSIGGLVSFFEADAVAATFTDDIHVGEIKSFPTVDGQADPEKLGAALAQAAIYILLLKQLVADCGGDPARVSPDALLITTRNTGMQPFMTVKPTGREIDRAARILDSIVPVDDLVAAIPAKTPGFGAVAKADKRGESERVESAHKILDVVGCVYQPSCLSSCGFSKLCRARAEKSGDLLRVGTQFQRLVPGVTSIDRVGQLAAGSRPAPGEEAAAFKLVQAQALLAELVGAPPKPPRAKGGKS